MDSEPSNDRLEEALDDLMKRAAAILKEIADELEDPGPQSGTG